MINKYQRIPEPEVCHWPSRDQIYHKCYAQTMRKPIDRWPVRLAECLGREGRVLNLHTNINKYKQTSTNINKCYQISRQIIKYQRISTNYQQISTNIIKDQQLSTNYQQISTNTWAGSLPLAHWRPNLSYMLCANHAQTNRSMARLARRKLGSGGAGIEFTYEYQ